jgi:hypothetical protein
MTVCRVSTSPSSCEHWPWTVRDGKAMVANIINHLSGGGEGDGLSGTADMLGEDMMD